jgi:hypothetical protein
MGEVSLILSSREVMLRVGVFEISVFFSERFRTASERSEVGWSGWFGTLEVAEFILKRE